MDFERTQRFLRREGTLLPVILTGLLSAVVIALVVWSLTARVPVCAESDRAGGRIDICRVSPLAWVGDRMGVQDLPESCREPRDLEEVR